MTEDEAKTKWCPFARTVLQVDSAGDALSIGNRHYHNDGPASFCIASSCMAWRWDQEPIRWSGRPGESMKPSEWEPSAEQGFCGLAGKP